MQSGAGAGRQTTHEPKPLSAGQIFFVVLNVLMLMFMVGATIVFSGVRLQAGHFARGAWFETAGLLLWMSAFIVALYFAEGSEIAVTTIEGRDEEELVLSSSAKALLREVHDHLSDFVSGRQFIVIVLVVLFAALCEDFARTSVDLTTRADKPIPVPPWPMSSLFHPYAVNLYAYGFPILTALWLSQLFSKFVAKRRPVTFFQDARRLIAPSLWLGRTVMVGFVSTKLEAYILRGKPDDPRTPSRRRLYEALAAFRDGFGFDRTNVHLTIDPTDGSLDVVVDCRVRAYAPGGMLFVQQDIWDGRIEGDVLVKVSRPATLGRFDFTPDRKRVEWSFLLANPLQAGETFSFEARYHVGADGVKHGPRAVGEFYYEQQKYPMGDLYVFVRLTDTSTFILSPNRIIPKVSYVGETDVREAARFRSGIVAKDGGVDFHIDYPLMGGTYVCEWTMGIKAAALAITP